MINKKKKLLLIGWDGADWNVISPLMDAGKMPNIKKLVENGVMGNMATLYPPLSPMLWTSIATGKRPYKHGIYGFSEPVPNGKGIRPITNLSRRARALWNMFTTQNMKSNVIGWWPSHPAEPIDGVMVSDMYQKQLGRLNRDEGEDTPARWIGGDEILEKMNANWPLRPNSVHPERLMEPLAKFRVHPQEMTAEAIGPFVPDMHKVDQKKDHRLETVAKILCECSSIHAAATSTMQLEPWDFMAVYYDSIDHFSHGFMQFHPPRLPWVKEEEFELYQHVVETGYIYHDMMLGTLMQLAGDETTIMLVSDHGFHSDHNRPAQVSDEPAGPAEQHSHYGIFLMSGPGTKKDERIYGANLLDVTPTILHFYGLPVGEDMDGKVLVNAFADSRPIETIPSWDAVEGPDGCHSEDSVMDPIETKAALDQLVALGYIEKPDDDLEKAINDTTRELEYNLARSYVDAGMYAHAEEILDRLYTNDPDQYRFGIQLVNCWLRLGQFDRVEPVLKALEKSKKANAKQAREEIKQLFEQYKNPDTDEIDWDGMDEQTQRKLTKLQKESRINPYAFDVLRASLHAAKEDHEQARHSYEAAVKHGGIHAVALPYAETLCQLKEFEQAEKICMKAMEMNPKNAQAHLTLAKVYYHLGKLQLAERQAVDSVGLLFHYPEAHYWLGMIALNRGQTPRAVEALRVAVTQSPNYVAAWEALVNIYQDRLKEPEEVERLRANLEQARSTLEAMKDGNFDTRQNTDNSRRALSSDIEPLRLNAEEHTLHFAPLGESVVVVSGLPRSGTSMMMQMLDAGGYPLLTDNKRKANESNPKGYFEYAPVTALARNNAWLPEAKGKGVKIIAQLLWNLPPGDHLNYRIVFMERYLDEIVLSQNKMLRSQANKLIANNPDTLKRTFRKQLTRIKRFIRAYHLPVLYIDYRESIDDPMGTAKKVNDFMDGVLDESKMAEAIAPSLYRNRSQM
ncbi:hypothetical protein DSCO28_71080 [Desulfosarcina ovata subsp. sediminis]|uniref:Uncharacterized protein n=1 Tax=Desulfosarcina ovata subsp. sediminis TaxID=885957 RepID=A0A5K8A1X0_9BACT|nr:alkaline phosphatase family protein [Desulfosarcina ovata]BBO86542.1 hypothetical protein DSCO28_71080 [Desulfosarcina ovata subsp. sediminis]